MISLREFLPAGPAFEALRLEAAQNYRFIETLKRRWSDGSDRYALSGEIFIAAFDGHELLGVGGLNRDPYLNDGTGRIRHVYVLENARGRGVGRLVVDHLVNHARMSFPRVRLRAADEEACKFYDALGFQRTDEQHTTHELVLTQHE
jgi:GNAT superfamily N-acetyltransferase